MVLPEPAADDAQAQAVGWIDEIALSLGLSATGAIALVDEAHPARLGDLVRTLRHTWPDIEVHANVRALDDLAPGSAVVLEPRAANADWLNQRRQLFAERRLKVVLWCDAETTVALARGAPDLFDWIAHRQTCPPGPPPFAVRGLRAAFAAKWPVLWTGADPAEVIEEVVRAAGEGRVSWVDGSEPYERVLERLADRGVVAIRIGSPRQLRRARWALAEARPSSRVILVAPGLDCPGFWPLRARFEELRSACEALAGAHAPGRLAALLDLEPEAIEHVRELLKNGVASRDVEAAVVEDMDPDAGLSRLLRHKEEASGDRPILLCEDPLVLRRISRQERAQESFAAWLRQVKEDQRDVGPWAAHAQGEIIDRLTMSLELRAWSLEPVLRANRREDISWLALATAAASLGERRVGAWWLLRIPERWWRREINKCLRRARGEEDAVKSLESIQVAAFMVGKGIAALKGSLIGWGCIAVPLGCLLLLMFGGMDVAAYSKPWINAAWPALALAGVGFSMWRWSRAILLFEERRGGRFLATENKLFTEVNTELTEAVSSLRGVNVLDADQRARHACEKAARNLGEEHPLYERAVRFRATLLHESRLGHEALALVSPLLSPEREIPAELSLLTARILAGIGRAGDAVRMLQHLIGAAPSPNGALLPASPAAPTEEPSIDVLLKAPAGTLAQNPYAHLALVEALLKQGRYPEALITARAAVTTFANDPSDAVPKLRAQITELERRLGPTATLPANAKHP